MLLAGLMHAAVGRWAGAEYLTTTGTNTSGARRAVSGDTRTGSLSRSRNAPGGCGCMVGLALYKRVLNIPVPR